MTAVIAGDGYVRHLLEDYSSSRPMMNAPGIGDTTTNSILLVVMITTITGLEVHPLLATIAWLDLEEEGKQKVP